MASIFSFAFTSVAIVGLIVFKNWEIKSGKTIFHDIRFKIDKSIVRWSTFLRSHVPSKGKHLSKEIILHSVFYISHTALGGVKLIEHKLIRVINFIKGKGMVKKDVQASHYLKNVSEFERHPDRK